MSPRNLAFLFFCSSSAALAAGPALSPGRAEHGDWVQFYSRSANAGLQQYYYDRSSVRRSRDVVAARWKILGRGNAATTLYVIEIECRQGTFTERGTVQIDAAGKARETPGAELYVNRPIATNTSTGIFRRMFCH